MGNAHDVERFQQRIAYLREHIRNTFAECDEGHQSPAYCAFRVWKDPRSVFSRPSVFIRATEGFMVDDDNDFENIAEAGLQEALRIMQERPCRQATHQGTLWLMSSGTKFEPYKNSTNYE